jgi:ParB family chromosome partitioning protein
MANAEVSGKRRRALGRGLSSLIPVENEGGGGSDIVLLKTAELSANPFQPRTEFEEDDIRELAESIRAQGLLQPIVVRGKAGGYEVVSGERRLRAMKLLGEERIPCMVKERVSDREMLEIALVENVQRQDLNEIDKAHAYDRLLQECGLSHEQLSKRIGGSRSAITNCLRLLKLPPELQHMVGAGALPMGHARALLGVDDAKLQQRLAKKIVAEGLSVRHVEKAVRRLGAPSKGRDTLRRTPEQDPDVQALVEKLQYRLGTAVDIVPRSGGAGRIEIKYYGSEDLDRVVGILLQ